MSSGIISGASNILIDFHPSPHTALCDSAQALDPSQLPILKSIAQESHNAYKNIVKLF